VRSRKFLGNVGYVCPAPAEVLTRILEPLWSVAVAVARDEPAEAQAALADANFASGHSSLRWLSCSESLAAVASPRVMKRSCEGAR
jgi:hypothetical protein